MARLSLLSAAAAVLLLASSSAHAATDCIGTLVAANGACGPEIAAVRDGKAPSTVSAACCRAAATLFGPDAAFGKDCACSSAVAPYRSLLDSAAAAVADKCTSVQLNSALPACSGGSVSTSAVSVAAPPAWGTGSVCVAQDTRCTTECTTYRQGNNPTQAQIDAAQRCNSASAGYCGGLGVEGAATGTTVCRTGIPLDADPRPRNGVSRKCFRCCVARLAPTGRARVGKNACQNPNRRSGGGGGGGGGGPCFHGAGTVVVEGKGTVAIRDLRIGDRVLSVSAADSSKPRFETVYFFGHQLPEATSEFVRLEMAVAGEEEGAAAVLELSHKHLIPVFNVSGTGAKKSNESSLFASATYTRAMDVRVGDKVVLVSGEDAAPVVAEVASARTVARSEGIYAPLTTGGGHIVVDGVLASVHSNNMLDSLGGFLGRRDLLHWAYETFGASVLKSVYRVIGPDAMAKASPIISGLGLGDAAQLAVGVRGLVAKTAPAAQKSA